MTTFQDEIQDLRRQFATIDKKDPKALRRWFEAHPHLKTTEHAIIAKRSLQYIRELKILAGLGKKNYTVKPPLSARPKIRTLVAPENWDNEEWLREAKKIHSIATIAQAVGADNQTVKKRLRRYGINTETKLITNRYCTKEWIEEYYVRQGLSQTKCAKLAGISQQTFGGWLVRFEIPVRSSRETLKGHTNIRLWVRKLFDNLKQQPVVNKVFLREDHIHVRFHNYYWESYYLDKSVKNGMSRIPRSFSVTEAISRVEHVPNVINQYESSLGGDEYPAHIIIPRKEWNQASFIEQRLAVHEFARQIVTRGWVWPNYPDSVITEELHRLQNLNPAKYMRKGGVFNAFPPYGIYPPPGRRLLEHFFDISELWEIISSPRWTLVCLNELTKKKKIAYHTHNFFRITTEIMPRWHSKKTPIIQDAGLYSILFKRLGIHGRVLDLSPNQGSRALACALNGIVYSTEPNDKMDLAIEKGFCEFTGLEYEQHDGSPADLVILDNDLRDCSVRKALSYAKQAKKIMVFVPRDKKNECIAKYKPSSIVPIKSRLYRQTPDFYFIW